MLLTAFLSYMCFTSYDTSYLLQHRTYVSCRSDSDVHSILLIRPTQELQILSVCSWQCYHKDVTVPAVAHFCMSDAQFLYFECTHFVGLMHSFVGLVHSFVGWMNTFCRSDAHSLLGLVMCWPSAASRTC